MTKGWATGQTGGTRGSGSQHIPASISVQSDSTHHTCDVGHWASPALGGLRGVILGLTHLGDALKTIWTTLLMLQMEK